MHILHSRMANAADPPFRGELPCYQCQGRGTLSDTQLTWVARGAVMYRTRHLLELGLREAAHRLGTMPSQLSGEECGTVDNSHRHSPDKLYPAEPRVVFTAFELAVLAISPEAIRCLASHHDMQVGGMDSMGYDEVAFHHEQRSAELGRYADRLVDAGRGELPVPDFRDGHIEA